MTKHNEKHRVNILAIAEMLGHEVICDVNGMGYAIKECESKNIKDWMDLDYDRDWNTIDKIITNIEMKQHPMFLNYKYQVTISKNWCIIDLGENTVGIEGTFIVRGKDRLDATFRAIGEFAHYINNVKLSKELNSIT